VVYSCVMVRVMFIDAAGCRHPVDAREGGTVMEAAIEHEIPGIVGFCGGMCECGTCHCYPEPAWTGRLPPVDDDEADTLRRVVERRPDSRLGCRITLTASLDGIVVVLPARQRVP
jgi:ferredoxin, 2Fe-2S